MENKKAKVTGAKYTDYHYPSYGKDMFVHFINLDNGDSGEYHSIEKEQTKFVVGTEIEYTIETKQVQKKDGTLMFQRDSETPWMKSRIKLVSTYTGNPGGGKSSYTEEDPKVIAREVALEVAAKHFEVHKVTEHLEYKESGIIIFCDDIAEWINIATDKNGRIRRASALKRVVMFMDITHYVKRTKTRTDLLELADEFLHYIEKGHGK